MKQEEAESIALEALVYIASDEYLMGGLINQTGLTLQDFKASASDPAFLGQVLDYFMTHDTAIGEFLEEKGYKDTMIRSARHALPGAHIYD